MRIRILPEAERDLDIGCDFYDSQSPGAARFFLRGLLDDIDGLLKHAGVHELDCGFFRAISKRFPFAKYLPIWNQRPRIPGAMSGTQGPAGLVRNRRCKPARVPRWATAHPSAPAAIGRSRGRGADRRP